MAYINKKSESKVLKSSHLNFMAGRSWDIGDPILRLRIAASSCFFGEPMYYHRDKDDKRPRKGVVSHSLYGRVRTLSDADVTRLRDTLNARDPREWRGMPPAKLLTSAIDAALDKDVEATLQLASRLRNEENIRVTPQVILVRAANHPKAKGTRLVRTYAPSIIGRIDEVSTQLAYHLSTYGEKAPIPNSLKRAWADALVKADAYQLAKYRQEGRQVKLVDVVNLAHPKVTPALDALIKGTLKNTDTWESALSAHGNKASVWLDVLPKMGHMALLRNLRNLLKAGVDPSAFIGKLVKGAKGGKQLPFRYFSAYTEVDRETSNPLVLDAIEQCLVESIGSLPRFSGKVISLCDNSGSATGTTTSAMGTMKVSTIANLTGIITGMTADEGYVGVFGDRLEVRSVRKRSSVFDQLKELDRIGSGIGGGTENGIWLFFDNAIRKKEHYDHIFVYSDMQAGYGCLYGLDASAYRDFAWATDGRYIDVAKLVQRYRQEVNPKVMVYLVQVAGYQDTIIPEFYDRTFILGGWSDNVLRFAHEMSQTFDALG